MVGIVTASGSYFGPRSARHAVAAAARDAGYVVASIDLANVTHEDMSSAVEDLTWIGVEGVVVVAGHDAAVDVAGNDHMALGVLRALNESGRRVPAGISVVGFDDIPEAAWLSSPLTTVHQDFTAVGRNAIGVLTAAIRGGDTAPVPLLRPHLVIRSTTAPRKEGT